MNNGGDVLARGAKRAQFSGPKVSQSQWDKIWADESDGSQIAEETNPATQNSQKPTQTRRKK